MPIVQIPLTQGKFATIDESDLELVSQFEWHAVERDCTWYAASSGLRRSTGEALYLHRFLCGLRDGDPRHVDHRNGEGLDCRRENMRICTNAQNRRNMRKTRGVSKYKGVAKNKDNGLRCWEAYIWLHDKKIPLGSYQTEDEAARAYNAASLQYHGEFGLLNEIEGLSREESILAPARNFKRGRPFSKKR